MIKQTCQKIWQHTKKNIVIVIIVFAAILIVAAGILSYELFFKNNAAKAAGQKAMDFINENYLKDTGKAEMKEASVVSGMYKITFKVTVDGQEQDQVAYITKDKKYLFPEMQGIPVDLDQKIEAATGQTANEVTTCEAVKKSDSPTVQAFVVSNCPYGLQMQRVLAKLVGDKSSTKNNIKVMYMGAISNGKITSMHGDEEAQENLRQICLREEQPNKYWSYISCYIQEGKTDACLTSTGVNKSSLDTCMTDSSKGLAYAQNDFTLSDQYGVSGSPTIIVDGDRVDEFSFGGRTEDSLKSIICCASNTQPGYCSQILSQDSAAASFSIDYAEGASSNANASCE